MKKINRIRKASKERSKLKKEIEKTKEFMQTLKEEQAVEMAEGNIFAMNDMKNRIELNLLKEFVPKGVAEKVLKEKVKQIKIYEQMKKKKEEQEMRQRAPSTVETEKSRSGSGSSKSSGKGVYTKKERKTKNKGAKMVNT